MPLGRPAGSVGQYIVCDHDGLDAFDAALGRGTVYVVDVDVLSLRPCEAQKGEYLGLLHRHGKHLGRREQVEVSAVSLSDGFEPVVVVVIITPHSLRLVDGRRVVGECQVIVRERQALTAMRQRHPPPQIIITRRHSRRHITPSSSAPLSPSLSLLASPPPALLESVPYVAIEGLAVLWDLAGLEVAVDAPTAAERPHQGEVLEVGVGLIWRLAALVWLPWIPPGSGAEKGLDDRVAVTLQRYYLQLAFRYQ
mmetsp:Transcript_14716/g.35089  ORF Transcript_14716/g.35089 Transcript_14716/m.35089 type:complete len:252 (-) Transcript_14716:1030-1785(-)